MGKRFAVVDIETTGALVRRDRITEIGIVITDGETILDRYESLINPGIAIPPFITKITGITDDMVKDAPSFPEVARKIVEMTDGCIFVAHNVRFDYGFLRAMFEELGYAYNKKRLCTVQMARRTLHLEKFSLGTLIEHFDIKVENRHRAMDDAYATAIVLGHLLKKDEHGKILDQQVNQGVRESVLPPDISLDDLHALPERPGVYYFSDKISEVVYVGKSKNIQKRVMSHFSKTTKKAEVLQKRVHGIDFVLTGSDLVAQIHEAHEIKKLKPEINRAQRASSFQHLLVCRTNSLGYIRFDLTTKVKSDDEILNAYPTKKSGYSMLNYLVQEFGLCPLYTHVEKGMGPCSLHQYDRCYGACIHEEAAEEYNERASIAKEYVNNIFDRDFVLLDEGRENSEKSVVAVVKGKYYGHGYVQEDASINNMSEWVDVVDQKKYFPEINSMIRRYIDQGGGEKIFYFEAPAEV